MKTRRGMGVVIIFMALFFVSACTKNEPMPLTKKNILSYLQKMGEYSQSITIKETESAKGDEKKRAEMLRRILAKAVEDMGYNYDKTIRIAATKIIEKDYPATDFEMQNSLTAMVLLPVQLREELVKLNIISRETKEVLDKIKI
jgi:hypothetical protein